MNWTKPADLRAQVQRLWDRGELLRDTVSEPMRWPLRLALKTPTAADLSERFDAVREWVGALVRTPHVRIEWRDWHHRVQGKQRLPAGVWIDSLSAALSWIGQSEAADSFRSLWRQTGSLQPALLPWLLRRPLQALSLRECWPRLLAVVAWLQAHPRPGVYLRQVDAPGVDSKFIETHRGVLTEWLDLALPPDAIDADAVGAAQFARRYGFLEKPLRIRFRPLDPAMAWPPDVEGMPDITLDAASFAALKLPLRRVFITENETNFLAFPPQARSIVIFGAGYGWEGLAQASWLRGCDMHYWGDIDTHGFAILNELRGHFPQMASLLMDRETLLAHQAHWGHEPKPVRQALERLTPEEAALHEDLLNGRWRSGLRLEQEHVNFGWLLARLARLP